MSSAAPQGCNCLCIVNHPDQRGVCSATADTAIKFYADSTGEVDVAMCAACATATLAKKGNQHNTGGTT